MGEVCGRRARFQIVDAAELVTSPPVYALDGDAGRSGREFDADLAAQVRQRRGCAVITRDVEDGELRRVEDRGGDSAVYEGATGLNPITGLAA